MVYDVYELVGGWAYDSPVADPDAVNDICMPVLNIRNPQRCQKIHHIVGTVLPKEQLVTIISLMGWR